MKSYVARDLRKGYIISKTEVHYTMHDLSIRKAMYWKTRLKEYMDTGKYTQVSFAEALNNKYGTAYGQKDVSRWLHTGDKIKKGEIGFPKYDTMVLIADFFNVDVGYLTGETDEDTFSLDKVCSYMGLNGEAIKVIREITEIEKKTSYFGKYKRDTFNKVLAAKEFPDFFESLYDLHYISIPPNCLFENLDSAIDYMHDLEYQGKLARYTLNEELVKLINEIYPNPPEMNLNIKEASDT